MEFDQGIVVNETEKLLRPAYETRYDAIRMDALEPVGDRSGFEQLHHAIREHLGVNPQVSLLAQAEERRVRYRSDAHLQRRTVLDHPRDDLADASIHLRL